MVCFNKNSNKDTAKMAFQTKPSAEVLQNSVNWMCGEDVVGVKIHKVYSTLFTDGEINTFF